MSLLEQTQGVKKLLKIYTSILTEREGKYKLIYKYERKLNKKNCYLLFITIIAIVSLIGNAYQDKHYTESIKSYKRELKTADNTYLELQKEHKKVNDNLKIITDEYNDLLERSK